MVRTEASTKSFIVPPQGQLGHRPVVKARRYLKSRHVERRHPNNALLTDAANRPVLAPLRAKPAPRRRPRALRWSERSSSGGTPEPTVGGERRLATHTGALMWSALGTRAPGTCAPGEFGEWARQPRPTA